MNSYNQYYYSSPHNSDQLPPSYQHQHKSIENNRSSVQYSGSDNSTAKSYSDRTSVLDFDDFTRPKRKQVKNACVNCQKACKKCDNGRPCQRCINYKLTETCQNSVRKERKKGLKRGPYKHHDSYQPKRRRKRNTTKIVKKEEEDSNLLPVIIKEEDGDDVNSIYTQNRSQQQQQAAAVSMSVPHNSIIDHNISKNVTPPETPETVVYHHHHNPNSRRAALTSFNSTIRNNSYDNNGHFSYPNSAIYNSHFTDTDSHLHSHNLTSTIPSPMSKYNDNITNNNINYRSPTAELMTTHEGGQFDHEPIDMYPYYSNYNIPQQLPHDMPIYGTPVSSSHLSSVSSSGGNRIEGSGLLTIDSSWWTPTNRNREVS